eukprot:6196125-Pleurochrysis_carterae.AAC.2
MSFSVYWPIMPVGNMALPHVVSSCAWSFSRHAVSLFAPHDGRNTHQLWNSAWRCEQATFLSCTHLYVMSRARLVLSSIPSLLLHVPTQVHSRCVSTSVAARVDNEGNPSAVLSNIAIVTRVGSCSVFSTMKTVDSAPSQS